MSATQPAVVTNHSSLTAHVSRLVVDWRLHWFLLLLPVALLLPALPIDETRYLAVAWEMYERVDYGVLHLNGTPYADKGPLLFWLINIAWLFFGPHVWVVRVLALAVSAASLLMFQQLAYRLNPNKAFAGRAALLLCGIVYFSLFSSAVMFDIVLVACVLITLHGVLDLDARYWPWGVATMAIGLGLGLLTKGPVVLLDATCLLVFGPWWSATARAHKARWYACSVVGVVGAIAIALCWAIPAASRGGPDYAHAIFLGQTFDRVSKSFSHARPIWWYLPLLPAMLLPWTICVRAPWQRWRSALTDSKAARFATIWFVPAFVGFCLISGKQPHYLLPLLPAVALYLSHVMQGADIRIAGRAFGIMLSTLALGTLCYMYFFLPMQSSLPRAEIGIVLANVWLIWPILLGILGVRLIVRADANVRIHEIAFTSVGASIIVMFGAIQAFAPRSDVTIAAEHIKNAQREHVSMVSLGPNQGLFEFAGRLANPINTVGFDQLPAWCSTQPGGEIVTIYNKYSINTRPVVEQLFESGHIRIWRAADVCAALDTDVVTESPEEQSE